MITSLLDDRLYRNHRFSLIMIIIYSQKLPKQIKPKLARSIVRQEPDHQRGPGYRMTYLMLLSRILYPGDEKTPSKGMAECQQDSMLILQRPLLEYIFLHFGGFKI